MDDDFDLYDETEAWYYDEELDCYIGEDEDYEYEEIKQTEADAQVMGFLLKTPDTILPVQTDGEQIGYFTP